MLQHRILLDLQATQSQSHADRGVARFVKEQIRALLRAGVGDALLLNPHLPFPRALDQDLLTSPLLRWATQSEVRRVLDAGDRPLAYYLMSPFELSLRGEGDLPPHLLRGDVPVAATLYDLIPLVMSERYLADEIIERRYRARAEQLHHVDLVLTISEHTRLDAIRLLGLDAEKVVNIGFGVSPFFRPAGTGDAPDVLLNRHVPQVRRPFVASVLGGDPRKNAERLFEAWAEVRRSTGTDQQLVVTCSLDPATRAAWEMSAKGAGLEGDDVVLTGWQPDDVLRALYQRCELLVFPSLYEGAGLPPAEAIACGAPAVTSSTSSMPEVLEWPDATFDPESVADMARVIAQAVTDEEFRESLRRRGAERRRELTWDRVAERTIDALATLPVPEGGRTRLPVRVALVGPMPPTASGIADYNARLLPALAERCDVDVFTPGSAPPFEVHRNVRWFPPRALKETCSPWAYDAVVFTAGNSDDHHDLYDLAQEFPGVLWLHDVRLPGLYLTYAEARVGEERAEEFLRERLLRQYRRRLPLHVRDDPTCHQSTGYIEHGLGLTKELVDVARCVIVSSALATRLLQLDQQPDTFAKPMHVVPLAAAPPWGDGSRRAPASAPVLVSLGMVAPVKATELLISALAGLRASGVAARLVFVGPVDDGYREHLERHIDAAGVTGHVAFTNRVTDDEYRDWLETATLALQLRLTTNGESSAAVTDCLSAGLPVVTNVHAATELPSGTVSLVPWDVDPAALATHVGTLLADPSRLQALTDGGHAFARTWGFDHVADRLLEIVRSLTD